MEYIKCEISLEGGSLSDLPLHNMVSECAERKDFTHVRWWKNKKIQPRNSLFQTIKLL